MKKPGFLETAARRDTACIPDTPPERARCFGTRRSRALLEWARSPTVQQGRVPPPRAHSTEVATAIPVLKQEIVAVGTIGNESVTEP